MIDVTAVGSPERAEHDIYGMTFGVFGQLVQAAFVVKGPLCDLGIPSLALIALLRSFGEKQ